MTNNNDLRRELVKVLDVLENATIYFQHQSKMNAELHMAKSVRPAPLATAVESATVDLKGFIDRNYPIEEYKGGPEIGYERAALIAALDPTSETDLLGDRVPPGANDSD